MNKPDPLSLFKKQIDNLAETLAPIANKKLQHLASTQHYSTAEVILLAAICNRSAIILPS